MRVSLNEVLLTTLKAARGTGLAEGLAEDVAQAAAWLARHGHDGVHAALTALSPAPTPGPVTLLLRDGAWHAEPTRAAIDAPSCLDRLTADAGAVIECRDIDSPWLLIGLAGRAASEHGLGVALRWAEGASCTVHAHGVDWTAGTAPGTDGCMRRAAPLAAGAPPPPPGVEVADQRWRALLALAARTYVPASEHSRAHGAGAGLIDTD